MSDKAKFEAGTYSADDILDWYDENTNETYINSLKNSDRSVFDEVIDHEDDGVIYEIGTVDGVSVILGEKKKPEIFGQNLDTLEAAGDKSLDILQATPGFLADMLNPKNIAKGMNQGVVNAFQLVDSLTGGSVTKLDNYFTENFPNTLGKKIEYKQPEGAGGVTGSIIGQYVVPGMGLLKLLRGSVLLSEPLLVGAFSSKDEGNMANLFKDMFPDFTRNNEAANIIINGLIADEDDSEVIGRLKNIAADSPIAFGLEGIFKIYKSLFKNEEAIQEIKSVGAAATPKEAPTTPVVTQGDTGFVKLNISDDNLSYAGYDGVRYDEGSERPFKLFFENAEDHHKSFQTQEETENFINSKIEKLKNIDEENARIRSISEKPFYSNVENAISNLTFKEQPGNQILATLNNTAGIKQSEIQDLGLDTFLKDNPNVTKEQLDDFIANKSLTTRVKDTILEDDPVAAFERRNDPNSTRFGQDDLVTPGGDNYKEMLITAPGTPQVFTDHHYKGSVPAGENLIAHARFNERIIDGKKILFVEEIQSDLHQAGRKKGYVSADRSKVENQLNALNKEVEDLRNEMKVVKEKSFYTRTDAPTYGAATKVDIIDGSNGKVFKSYELTGNQTEQANIVGKAAAEADDMNRIDGVNKKLGNLRVQINDIENKIEDLNEFGKVPDAPFKKNWYELTTKRLIKYAIDNDFEGIAFTTGKMQNDRYNLSKKITALRAEKIIGGTKDGQYELTVTPIYGEQISRVVPENELERFVGKDLTTKIIEDAPTYTDGRTYTGLDLEFGGDGMKGFYDNMLPSYLNKFGKKYGANLEQTNLPIKNTKIYNMKDLKNLKYNDVYDAVGTSGEIFASYKIIQDLEAPPSQKIKLIQTKNGKSNVIHQTYESRDAKAIMLDELEGFDVPQILNNKGANEVPIMFFTPDMKKEILTEGVPIAQVEEKENKQQTTAVV